MPNHLSTLGIIHTVISILALLTAFYSLTRFARINPANGAGKAYILLTIITCLTGLPIMKTGHPTPGHFLGVIILVLLPFGIFAKSIKPFGKGADYIQVFILSLTLFFSCIPAIVETLTRLPIGHPIAANPNANVIQMGLVILFTCFMAGVVYQIIKLKKTKSKARALSPLTNLG